jgi:hypothetical protein
MRKSRFGNGPNMLNARTLDWDHARAEISRVRPNLARCLDELYQMQVASGRRSLEVISVEYNYADNIIHEGRAMLPEAESFSENFIIGNKLPLGIITRNSCEVTAYESIGKTKVAFADTILVPGDFVGLFEAVDRITKVRFTPPPQWNIVAGVCSIHAIPNLATQQSRKRLARAYRYHLGDLGLSDAAGLIDQLKRLPPFHEIAQSWRAKILYFSRSWIEALETDPFSEPKLKLTDNLLRQAWVNLARIHDKDPRPLQRRLHEAVHETGDHGETADAAGSLFKGVGDVLAGRHPVYIPLAENSSSGPFGDIAEKILSHITKQSWVLSPAYLSDTVKSGYLKLEHLVPAILAPRSEGGIKDRVLELMNVLRLAVRNKARAGDRDEEMTFYTECLNNIMFQTPAAGSGVERRPSIYMVRFDPRRLSAEPKDFSADDFYSPQFRVHPNERCAFFRSSVKIDGSIQDEMAS